MGQTQPSGFENDPGRRLKRRTPAAPVRGAPDRPKIVLLDQLKPAVAKLSTEGFTVSDYADLERAGDWLNCPDPLCPNRAYLTIVYPTLEAALASIDGRGRALSHGTMSLRPRALTSVGSLNFNISWIQVTDFVGRDYRLAGCQLPNAAQQLRSGRGTEPAWREIRTQREEELVEGALLPSHTPAGALFLFVDAARRIRRQERVRTVGWRWDRPIASA